MQVKEFVLETIHRASNQRKLTDFIGQGLVLNPIHLVNLVLKPLIPKLWAAASDAPIRAGQGLCIGDDP